MSNQWIEFNDVNYQTDRVHPRVLLDVRRIFRLNAKALELLGRPKAIRFLFDANDNRIGIRAEDPEKPHAFRVLQEKPNSKIGYVRGFSFCKRFGIKPEYPLAFDQVRVDPDGTLILDLASAKRKAN